MSKARLLAYREFIVKRFNVETTLTGREDFQWEEYFLFGHGSESEYQRLKKTKPSYKDEFLLIHIKKTDLVQGKDLLAVVERLSDHKQFNIGLSWLTTKNRKGRDFQLLDDYATWIANWC